MTNVLKCTEMCSLPDCENKASCSDDEESADEDETEIDDDFSSP